MPFKLKTAWSEAREVGETAVDFEDAIACPAAKVMVVALARDFVALRLAGELNGDEPALGHEGFEGPVDGGDT